LFFQGVQVFVFLAKVPPLLFHQKEKDTLSQYADECQVYPFLKAYRPLCKLSHKLFLRHEK